MNVHLILTVSRSLKKQCRDLPSHALIDDLYTLKDLREERDSLDNKSALPLLPAELVVYTRMNEAFEKGRDLRDEDRIIPWSTLLQINQKVGEFVGIPGKALLVYTKDLTRSGNMIEVVPDFDRTRILRNFPQSSPTGANVDPETRMAVAANLIDLESTFEQVVKQGQEVIDAYKGTVRLFSRLFVAGIRVPILEFDKLTGRYILSLDTNWNRHYGLAYAEPDPVCALEKTLYDGLKILGWAV